MQIKIFSGMDIESEINNLLKNNSEIEICHVFPTQSAGLVITIFTGLGRPPASQNSQ